MNVIKDYLLCKQSKLSMPTIKTYLYKQTDLFRYSKSEQSVSLECTSLSKNFHQSTELLV